MKTSLFLCLLSGRSNRHLVSALALGVTLTLSAAAVEPVAACCAADAKPAAKSDACCATEEKPAAKPDACCEAMAREAFSKESLYQTAATFTTDAGKPFTLGQLRGQPIVLTMFFASCGYACPLLVTDMQSIRAQLPAELRDKARFVLVSFDVARDTPPALAKYRAQRALDDQWVLLHGDEESVREIAALLGVKYKQEADGSFAHSNLVTILNSEGEIVHQRAGLEGGLPAAAAALVAAATAR
jgi:protein SCO1